MVTQQGTVWSRTSWTLSYNGFAHDISTMQSLIINCISWSVSSYTYFRKICEAVLCYKIVMSRSGKKGEKKTGIGHENWRNIFLYPLLDFRWIADFTMIWCFSFPYVSGLWGNKEGGLVVFEFPHRLARRISHQTFHEHVRKQLSLLPHKPVGSALSSSMCVRQALKHLLMFLVLFNYSPENCHHNVLLYCLGGVFSFIPFSSISYEQ